MLDAGVVHVNFYKNKESHSGRIFFDFSDDLEF